MIPAADAEGNRDLAPTTANYENRVSLAFPLRPSICFAFIDSCGAAIRLTIIGERPRVRDTSTRNHISTGRASACPRFVCPLGDGRAEPAVENFRERKVPRGGMRVAVSGASADSKGSLFS